MRVKTTIKALLSAVSALFLTFFWMSGAGAHTCPQFTQPPATGNTIIQEFPPAGPMQTAWKVRFGHATAKGLYITGAWFKKAPGEPWMRVLWDARVADIFVPYHSGSPRYYDLTNFNFSLVNATAADAGDCGRIIDGKIIHEVSNYGILWKNDTAVRHGYELVLWGTLDSANYNYVMRYAFQDNGTIKLRMGATSRNLPGREYEAHMHNALWRIDMDLNGYAKDFPVAARHSETTSSLTANDGLGLINGFWEGRLDWDPKRFTELRVFDLSKKNSQGNFISYDFRPIRLGTPRHQENFTHTDFFVTRYHGNEHTYKLVNNYVNGESIISQDIVVWHISPLHHEVRDEDGHFSGRYWDGVALLMWSGIDLRPRNLFDKTPLFP